MRFAAFAKKWNLNYKVLSYAGAWRATFGNLDKVGQHYYVNGTKQTRGDERARRASDRADEDPRGVSNERRRDEKNLP